MFFKNTLSSEQFCTNLKLISLKFKNNLASAEEQSHKFSI